MCYKKKAHIPCGILPSGGEYNENLVILKFYIVKKNGEYKNICLNISILR